MVPTDVTVGALPGGGTGAVEGTVRVHTGGAIHTRNVQTLIHIYKYSQNILSTTTHCLQCPCNIVSISNFHSILQFIFFSWAKEFYMYLFRTGVRPSLVCKYMNLLQASHDRLRCFHKETGCKYWCLAKVRTKSNPVYLQPYFDKTLI